MLCTLNSGLFPPAPIPMPTTPAPITPIRAYTHFLHLSSFFPLPQPPHALSLPIALPIVIYPPSTPDTPLLPSPPSLPPCRPCPSTPRRRLRYSALARGVEVSTLQKFVAEYDPSSPALTVQVCKCLSCRKVCTCLCACPCAIAAYLCSCSAVAAVAVDTRKAVTPSLFLLAL